MSGAAGDRHVIELLTPYYLDMLDRVEGPLVTAHLDDCADCRGAADAVIETIAVLALLPEADREELLDNFGALNRTGPPPARFVEFLAHEPEPEPAPGLRRRLRDRAGPGSSRAAQVAAPAVPSPAAPAAHPPVSDTTAPTPAAPTSSALSDTTAPSPTASRTTAPSPTASRTTAPAATPAAPASAATVPPPSSDAAAAAAAAAAAVRSTPPAAPAPASVPQAPARTPAAVSRAAPVVPGPTPRSSEPLASEPIVPTAAHPGPTRPVGQEERKLGTTGPLRTPGPRAAAVAATPTGVRGDRRRPGGETHADRRAVPTRRRRGAMVRTGLLLTTALAVAGLAIGALVQHVDRVAPPLAVTVTAVAADSATGASLSVVATGQDDGVNVRAAVDGLRTGSGYRLMAATSDGRVWRVLSWEADDTTQNVSGHLAVPLASVASFSVARAGGGAIVTANVPPRR
ncbi:hypothetical protein ACTFTM_00170 [Micromonospora sp. RB23]